jgi:pyruvate kinase
MLSDVKYNKTKIVATLGPATSNYKTLKEIILAGVDTCRINFSHGSYEDHTKAIELVDQVNKELGTSVSVLGDLQGPKLRIGQMPEEGVFYEKGDVVTITTKEQVGDKNTLYVNYEQLPTEIQVDEWVLLDDGKVSFKVIEKIDETQFKVKVTTGGKLTSNKGFNLPSTNLSLPSMTEKDFQDLNYALEHHIAWVALSFVRTADEIVKLKKYILDRGKHTNVIAKIEKPQAVENIDAIIAATDGIMVARGDLGVEMPMEVVPMIQKSIVDKCIRASTPVIIATQMMESMIENPRPTRAEANDVANAVMDGADAVMLSAETSVGKYPLETVESVERILGSTELGWDIYYKGEKPNPKSETFLSDEICFTAVRMSDHINAKAIVSLTYSGYTAFKIASFRPNCDVFIFTSNKRIFRMLSLIWNVRVFYYDKTESTDQTMKDVLEILKKEGLVNRGDLVVHTASMPILDKLRTNALKISEVK